MVRGSSAVDVRRVSLRNGESCCRQPAGLPPVTLIVPMGEAFRIDPVHFEFIFIACGVGYGLDLEWTRLRDARLSCSRVVG